MVPAVQDFALARRGQFHLNLVAENVDQKFNREHVPIPYVGGSSKFFDLVRDKKPATITHLLTTETHHKIAIQGQRLYSNTSASSK